MRSPRWRAVGPTNCQGPTALDRLRAPRPGRSPGAPTPRARSGAPRPRGSGRCPPVGGGPAQPLGESPGALPPEVGLPQQDLGAGQILRAPPRLGRRLLLPRGLDRGRPGQPSQHVGPRPERQHRGGEGPPLLPRGRSRRPEADQEVLGRPGGGQGSPGLQEHPGGGELQAEIGRTGPGRTGIGGDGLGRSRGGSRRGSGGASRGQGGGDEEEGSPQWVHGAGVYQPATAPKSAGALPGQDARLSGR